MSNTIIITLILLLYFLSFGSYLIQLLSKAGKTSPIILLMSGLLLHLILLLQKGYTASGAITIDLSSSLGFLSFALAAVYVISSLFLGLIKARLAIMGAFVVPVVFILFLLSSILTSSGDRIPDSLLSFWLPIHAFSAFFSEAAFFYSFIISLTYLVQEHFLKRSVSRRIIDMLPAQQLLDELNLKMISLGFMLITFAIATGMLWSKSTWGSYLIWDARVIWTIISWILYAAILHLRFVAGFRGKKMALITVLAFASLMGSFIIINLARIGKHIDQFV